MAKMTGTTKMTGMARPTGTTKLMGMARPRPPAATIAAAIIISALACCLAFLCAGSAAPTQAAGFTAEYRAFLATRVADGPAVTQDGPDGYRFILENGRFRIIGTDNAEIWRSKDEWHVSSFRIGDIDGDGILDVAFALWKSYSFGKIHPARMSNEDASVRCHLFVYSVKDNRAKPLWCSSSLPRPIYAFELYTDGERAATLPGTRLIAQEGAYTEDYSETAPTEHRYEWSGWGFSPQP
ncbi:MAG: hypothetical protein LBH39_02730 [Clostridiales Family XIII bacterium]|jgi:hypothetical protein|nr:hypothetical protein [Clostridiales Family XIII bacterium]